MEAMRSTWTDERLDDFRDNVDRRFDAVDRRFDSVDRRFDVVEGKIAEQTARIDALQHAMTLGVIAIMGAMITGFAGLAGLILTQT